MATIVRTPDRSENIDLLFASRTWFHFIMCMKHADGCSEPTNIRWSESYCFLSSFNFNILVYPPFAAIAAAHLSGDNIFPENFNTNVIPCLLQLKPKAFLWIYNRSVYFPTRPKFVRWGWGPDFEGASPSFSMFQQIPSVAGSSGNSLFYGYIFA